MEGPCHLMEGGRVLALAQARCRGRGSLLAAEAPELKVITEPFGPGDGLEVALGGYIGLEEPTAADLLDREEAAAEADEAPALRVVVLLWACDHSEIQAFDLMRVEEPAAADL